MTDREGGAAVIRPLSLDDRTSREQLPVSAMAQAQTERIGRLSLVLQSSNITDILDVRTPGL